MDDLEDDVNPVYRWLDGEKAPVPNIGDGAYHRVMFLSVTFETIKLRRKKAS